MLSTDTKQIIARNTKSQGLALFVIARSCWALGTCSTGKVRERIIKPWALTDSPGSSIRYLPSSHLSPSGVLSCL
jgi:hypothetical protein